jgi:hypothetical protein
LRIVIVSVLAKLNAAKAEAGGSGGDDPWRLRLERVRGKIDYHDGLERISTQTLFDILEVPQRARTAGTCRRLAAAMRQLGWSPIRLKDFARGGYLEQVRGYCRQARSEPEPVGHSHDQPDKVR